MDEWFWSESGHLYQYKFLKMHKTVKSGLLHGSAVPGRSRCICPRDAVQKRISQCVASKA
jgi:hypothetical protein